MSATATARHRPVRLSSARPVIAAPALSVVPSPAPRRGFILTVALCIALVFSALLLSFYLNTRMVQGAYEIMDIKVELEAVQMQEESLESAAVGATSPAALKANATDLGMVPAATLREVSLDSGTLSAVSTPSE